MCLIITFILIISTAFIINAEEVSKIPNVSTNEEPFYLKKQVSIHNKYETCLVGLGIFDSYKNKELKRETVLTKSEFSAFVVKLLGIDVSEWEKINTNFNDVKRDYWASRQINLLQSINVISTSNEKLFYPDEAITEEQAIKILVGILGYADNANNIGGYPAGYISVAHTIGLTRGINISMGEALKMEKCTRLLYNALDSDIMEQTSFGDFYKYSIIRGKTLANQYLKVYKITDVVKANTKTNLLFADDTLADDEIKIGNTIFKIGVTAANDFLGYKVEAYYQKKNDTDERIILSVWSDDKLSESVTIEAQKILDFSKDTIKYYKEKEKETHSIKLDNLVNVIYNGIAVTLDFVQNDILPQNGWITAIDSNNDGVYDVIFVNSFVNYIADNVNLEKYEISDKLNKPSILLNESKNALVNIYKNGKKIKITDINEWNTLSVTCDSRRTIIGKKIWDFSNAKIINIYVSDNVIKLGEIKELYDDKVLINNKEYQISSTYSENGSRTLNIPLKVGRIGVVYLDIANRIVAVDFYEGMENTYGYLIKTGPKSGVDKRAEFLIFTSSNKAEKFISAATVIIDGERINAMDVVEILKNKPQLLTYKLNSKKEICKIDTIILGKYENQNDSLVLSKSNISSRYSATNNSFEIGFSVSDSCIIFSIPNNRELLEDYSVGFSSNLKDKITYTMDVYNIDDNYSTNLIVRYYNKNDDIDITEDLPIAIIDKISRVTNIDGTEVPKLTYLSDGKLYSCELFNDDVLKLDSNDKPLPDLKRGDAIKVFMQDKKILKIKYIFSCRDINGVKSQNFATTSYTATYRDVFGQIINAY
jgi:hypothetical protein